MVALLLPAAVRFFRKACRTSSRDRLFRFWGLFKNRSFHSSLPSGNWPRLILAGIKDIASLMRENVRMENLRSTTPVLQNLHDFVRQRERHKRPRRIAETALPFRHKQ